MRAALILQSNPAKFWSVSIATFTFTSFEGGTTCDVALNKKARAFRSLDSGLWQERVSFFIRTTSFLTAITPLYDDLKHAHHSKSTRRAWTNNCTS